MEKKIIDGVAENEELSMTAADLRKLLVERDEPGKNGSLNARQRLTALFDAGTFTEIGAYIMRRISEYDSASPDEFESVICGYGSVDGCLVYAFSQDLTRTKGSVSEAAAKKICNVYDLAISNGCPIVGVFDSAGAYLPEGVRALGAYGSIMKVVAKASGVIPQIAFVAGIAQGAAAVICSMFDFIVATKDTKISVNPPFVVGGGTTEDSVEAGLVSVTAEDDLDGAAKVRTILSLIPSNNEDFGAEVETADDVNRLVDISSYVSDRKISSLIVAIADDGRYFEISADYAKSMSCGFISMGGIVCGLVATDYSENEGRLSSKGARKAAKFINFCDAFAIPVITLVDSNGFVICGDEEKNPYSAEIGKLAGAYAIAKTPLITLVSGSAYGSIFSVMGSKEIGADLVYALDDAKIGCMNAKSAVALLWNDKIGKETSREDLEAKWEEKISNVVEASRAGEIDDILEPAQVRQRLISAVMMLGGKAINPPKRRHANMPL